MYQGAFLVIRKYKRRIYFVRFKYLFFIFSHVNAKNFEIRGMVKIELSSRTILTKLKEEYIAYENENFYRINEKTKCKVRKHV